MSREAAGTPAPVDVLRWMAEKEFEHRIRTRPAGIQTEAEAAIAVLNAALRMYASRGTADAHLARANAYETMIRFADVSAFWRAPPLPAKKKRRGGR